jgi:filamentous hemagglutinin family protein
LIFNNSSAGGNSVTGGYVQGNANLSGGSAGVILNEVRGRVGSKLSGTMEVFGRKADVIIANENGVQCNGCSFLNTGRATLTTGNPSVDGSNISFDVRKGTVGVWGDGLTGVDDVELIGRHVIVDGKVEAAKSITASGGTQIYDYNKRQARSAPVGGKRSAPYAVDATAFGAMKSGQIRIIGNESGLGVRAGAKLSSSADILFRSKGDAQFRSLEAGGKVKIEATGKVTQPSGTASAKQGITIAGQSFANNRGAKVVAKGDVHINVRDFVNVSGEVTGRSVKVSAEKSVLNLGHILSGERLDVVAGEVTNKRPVTATYNTYYDSWIRRYVPWMKWYIGRYGDSDYNSRYYKLLLARSSYTALEDENILSGGVIEGLDVTIIAKISDIVNDGTITALNDLTLSARGDIINKALFERHRKDDDDCAWGDCYSAEIFEARLEAGGNAQLIAGRDILNQGGTITGKESVSLFAEHDIKNSSVAWRDLTTRETSSSSSNGYHYSGGSWWWRYYGYGGNYRYDDSYTEMVRHNMRSGLINSSDGAVNLRSGQDIINDGGVIDGVRSLTVIAGRDIKNNSVAWADRSRNGGSHASSYYGGYGGGNWWHNYYGYYGGNYNSSWNNDHIRQQILTGSLGSSSGLTYLQAGQDIINQGGRIDGRSGLTVIAGRDILNVSEAWADTDSYQYNYASSYYGGYGNNYGWWSRNYGYYGGNSSGSHNAYISRNQVLTGYLGASNGETYLKAASGSILNIGGHLDGEKALTATAKDGIYNLAAGFADLYHYDGNHRSSYSSNSGSRYGWWWRYYNNYRNSYNSSWSNDYERYQTREGVVTSAQGDVSLVAGGDINFRGGRALAAKTLTLDAGGAIGLLAAAFMEQNAHQRSGNSSYYGSYGYGWWWRRAYGGSSSYNQNWSDSWQKTTSSEIGGRNIRLYARGAGIDLNQDIHTTGSLLLYARDDINNRFDISARGDLTLHSQAGSVLNSGSASALGDLDVYAYRNIDSNYLSADGNLSLTALHGSITNRDYMGGSDVTIAAVRGDVINRGGLLQARDNLSISAGRDIRNELVANRTSNVTGGSFGSSRNHYWNGWWWYRYRRHDYTYGNWRQESVRHEVKDGNMLAGGDMLLTAGRDISFTGSNAKAGGLLSLDAGRDLNFTDASFTNYDNRRTTSRTRYDSFYRYSWWRGWRHYRRTYSGVSTRTDNRSWTDSYRSLLSGNDVSLVARGGSIITPSQIDVKRNLSIYAYNDLAVNSDLDVTGDLSLTSQFGALDNRGRINVSRNLSLYAWRDLGNHDAITAGGDLSLYSAYGAINNSGSATAGGDITARAYTNIDSRRLSAGGNLTLTALQGSITNRDILNGHDISLSAYGNVSNHNTITASGDLKLISQLGSINNFARASASGNLTASAYRDIDSNYLSAGGNLSLTALQGSITNRDYMGGRSVTLFAGLDINNSTNHPVGIVGTDRLGITAGRDFNNIGTGVSSAGDVLLKAGRNINLLSRLNGKTVYTRTSGGRAYSHQWWRTDWQQQVDLATVKGRNVTLKAGGDIRLRATQLTATADLSLNADGQISGDELAYGAGGDQLDRNWYKQRYKNWYRYWYKKRRGWRKYWTYRWTYNWRTRWAHSDQRRAWSNNATHNNQLTAANIVLSSGSGIDLRGIKAEASNALSLTADNGNIALERIDRVTAGGKLSFALNGDLTVSGGRVEAADYDLGQARNIRLATIIGNQNSDFIIDSQHNFTNSGTIYGRNIYLSANVIGGNGTYSASQDVDLWSQGNLATGGITGRYVDLYSSNGGINVTGNINAAESAALFAEGNISTRGVSGSWVTLRSYAGGINSNGTMLARTGDLSWRAKNAITANGNFSGNNISLTGASVAGRANYNALHDLTLDATGSITTGTLHGRDIKLSAATGSIAVYGGITAGNSAVLQANNNLYTGSVAARDAYLAATGGRLSLARNASYVVSNGLSLQTAGDFNVLDGQRFSIGGDLTIQAGGNINVKSRISGSSIYRSVLVQAAICGLPPAVPSSMKAEASPPGAT